MVGGCTVAVIGTETTKHYPAENRQLQDRTGLVSRKQLALVRDQARCAARPEAGLAVITGTVTGHHARSADLTCR
jgi:hypothetical protein